MLNAGKLPKAVLNLMAKVHDLSPNELVKRGCIQVMEGRHVFEHLTVEENLLTGTYTRKEGRSLFQRTLKKLTRTFPA
ncbi:MAG: hypothetical protein Ct9H300mP28_05180 [Pseudomonadota bacterium]|nr:MAG: hypothetical protein Ct9H300mP28_05180 [Pseudomonadota bacterium]